MTPPRRRWFTFSLRTMFVAVMLLTVPLGWLGYTLNWIGQRKAMLESGVIYLNDTGVPPPLGLGIFGEKGSSHINYDFRAVMPSEVRRLFPEATDISEQYSKEAYFRFNARQPWPPAALSGEGSS